MALVPVPGNACAIRLVAAAVLASCGSSAEPVSRAFAGVERENQVRDHRHRNPGSDDKEVGEPG